MRALDPKHQVLLEGADRRHYSPLSLETHCRLSTSACLLLALPHRLHPTAAFHDALQPPRYHKGTTSSTLPTLIVPLLVGTNQNVYKSILPPSSAICVPRNLPERTTCAHICVHIPTNAHLSARFVAKHLHDSMIANVTKVFIPGRRSSSAVAIFPQERTGAAADVSLALMLWGVISALKQGECAFSLC